ncbi:MAG: hypothetical protein WC829_02905, partial [Hyphomicrobium sp.]
PAATITLPVNCYTVRNVEAYDGSLWLPVRWIGAHSREQYQDGIGMPLAVRFAENTLVFEGSVTSATSVRVQFARAPTLLSTATVASATATAITFDSSAGLSAHDDVYIGDRVLVTSGTGINQTAIISDSVASTYTITVPTMGTVLDETSVVTWCLPDPLSKWPDVVVLGAAIRLVGRRRDAETHSVLMSQYANDVGEMMVSLAQRQTDQPRHVNYQAYGDE